MDGQPPPMSESEFAAHVFEAGNPALFGDWYSRSDRVPHDTGKEGFPGRVSVDLAAYLDAFKAGEIEDRITAFKRKLPCAPDANAVHELLRNTLTPSGWSSMVRPFSTVRIPALHTSLYRVRPGLTGPQDIKTVGDIWTPPNGTSSGRVNRPGQPILYTAAEYPAVALHETGARVGDVVALSCFSIIKDLDLLDLDDMDPQWRLNTSQHRKWRKLGQFYSWAFRHSGADPNSPQHLVPQVLTLDFNMLIPPLVGYAYRSVVISHPGAINLALDEEHAASSLRLAWTTVWQIGKPMSVLLATLTPKRPSIARNTPLVPGRFRWPSRLGINQRSYRRSI